MGVGKSGCCSAGPALELDAESLPLMYRSASDRSREREVTLPSGKPDAEQLPPWWSCLRCCLCCYAVLLVLIVCQYLLLVSAVSRDGVSTLLSPSTASEFLCQGLRSPANLTVNNVWPGCGLINGFEKLENCSRPCFDSALLKSMFAFNHEHGGTLVSYPSREHDGVQTANLTGWWLPAPRHPKAPRIVITHAFSGNSNVFEVQLAAYMLRSLGFSVLLNNLRDHCYSNHSGSATYQWGDAYVYDLLGAWDYARKDPDGLLGGPLGSGQVGVLGFSDGGLVTLSAFGVEGDIPAAWVDAPVLDPKAIFLRDRERQGYGPVLSALLPILEGPSWYVVAATAKMRGVSLEENLPLQSLLKGPDTKRPVFWVGSRNDTVVPFSEGLTLLDFLQNQTAKYTVYDYQTQGVCNGYTHNVAHLREFDSYQEKLCNFWAHAFGLDVEAVCA